MKTPKEILIDARNRVTKAWVKDIGAQLGSDNEHLAVCAAQAIVDASGKTDAMFYKNYPQLYVEGIQAAAIALMKVIDPAQRFTVPNWRTMGREEGWMESDETYTAWKDTLEPMGHIVMFNDLDTTTHEMILAKFEEAICNLEVAHA